MTDVPKPTSAGTSGTQTLGPASIPDVEVLPPTYGLKLQKAVGDLTTSRPQAFGGTGQTAMIAAYIEDLMNLNSNNQKTITNQNEEIRTLSVQLHEEKKLTAIINERLESQKRSHIIREFLIFIGMALIGIGIDLYKNNIFTISYIVGALGSLSLVFGWIFSRIGVTK